MANDHDPASGAAEAASVPGTEGRGVGGPLLRPQADPDASSVEGLAVSLTRAVQLQPQWLRPAIVFTVALAHAGTLTALTYIHSQSPPAVETIEATVIAAGEEAPVDLPATRASELATEPAPGAKPKPPAEPAEVSPAPASTAVVADEPPEPAPPVAAARETPPPMPNQPPPVETPPQAPPEAPRPVSAAEASSPSPPVVGSLEESAPAVERKIETATSPLSPPRVDTQPRPKREAKPAADRPRSAKPAAPRANSSGSDAKAGSRPEASEAHRVGNASGQPVDAGASRASYAALVVAEIQAHRFYPSSARERGEQGAVGVSFTIGPGGRVAAASVVRPSGFTELDDAARQIVRSIAPPPPPGGSFTASTTIRFHVE